MNSFLKKIAFVFADRPLRNRLLFVMGVLVLFRIMAALPVPGIDAEQLALFFNNNQFFGLLSLFSGGGLSRLSVVMLGVGPYITASIVLQLLTMMIPRLKALYQEEGELGRLRFAMYTRWITLPIALVQGVSFLMILERQGILPALGPFQFAANLLVITAGSMLLMWLGELISEFGLGNGVSVLIFAGIVVSLPGTVSQVLFSFDPAQVPTYIAFLALAAVTVWAVVMVTEAERSVPVTYAKRVRGQKVYGGQSTYLPLRLNQAGVIPIIFAISLLLIPQMVASFFAGSTNTTLAYAATSVNSFMQNHFVYGISYFFLVFIFTYFYTAVTFDPKQIAENLQKNGAFVPGVRPGKSTEAYLGRIITRITFVGAVFLGGIAVLPIIVESVTNIQQLTLGGTALLIVVSVILDLARRIDAQVSIREY